MTDTKERDRFIAELSSDEDDSDEDDEHDNSEFSFLPWFNEKTNKDTGSGAANQDTNKFKR